MKRDEHFYDSANKKKKFKCQEEKKPFEANEKNANPGRRPSRCNCVDDDGAGRARSRVEPQPKGKSLNSRGEKSAREGTAPLKSHQLDDRSTNNKETGWPMPAKGKTVPECNGTRTSAPYQNKRERKEGSCKRVWERGKKTCAATQP